MARSKTTYQISEDTLTKCIAVYSGGIQNLFTCSEMMVVVSMITTETGCSIQEARNFVEERYDASINYYNTDKMEDYEFKIVERTEALFNRLYKLNKEISSIINELEQIK